MEDQRVLSIRERIKEAMHSVSSSSLTLAWDLGAVRAEDLFRAWKYISFSEYVSGELRGHIGRSHAYLLSNIGLRFRPAKAAVERFVAERKVGIARLGHLAAMMEQQKLDLDRAMHHIEFGSPLPDGCGEDDAPRDPEGMVKIEMYVKVGDEAAIRRGLLKSALRNTFSTMDEAFIALALGEDADPYLPPWAERYLDRIEAGDFRCGRCQRIPKEPTEHHLFPQSIAQGDGETITLCWSPCHQAVQADWFNFACLKLGKRYVEEQLKKYKARSGKDT